MEYSVFKFNVKRCRNEKYGNKPSDGYVQGRSALQIGKHGNKGLLTATLAFIRSCTVLRIGHHILYQFKTGTHLSEEILWSCCGRSRSMSRNTLSLLSSVGNRTAVKSEQVRPDHWQKHTISLTEKPTGIYWKLNRVNLTANRTNIKPIVLKSNNSLGDGRTQLCTFLIKLFG